MNILFIVKRAGIGGVQTFTKVLIDYFELHGIRGETYFTIPDYFEDNSSFVGYQTHSLTNNGIKLKIINKSESLIKKFDNSYSFKKYLQKKQFERLLKNNKYDLIHLNTDTADHLLPIIKRFNIPIILTLHGIYKNIYLNIGNTNKEITRIKKLNTYFDYITFFTKDNLLDFSKSLGENYVNSSEKFVKLLNPYKKKILPEKKQQGTVRFGLFGRGFQSKGWQEALNAFEQAYIKNSNIELHFYGKGEFLENFVRDKDIEGFFFHGQTFNPIKEMQNIDVGLVPSYHEEMPYVVIEYLSLGIPVIGTNVGAIKEMLCDIKGKIAGQIIDVVDNKPAISQLVSAINRYAEDFSIIEEHSIRALEAYEKFDVSIIGKEYLSLYQKAINATK